MVLCGIPLLQLPLLAFFVVSAGLFLAWPVWLFGLLFAGALARRCVPVRTQARSGFWVFWMAFWSGGVAGALAFWNASGLGELVSLVLLPLALFSDALLDGPVSVLLTALVFCVIGARAGSRLVNHETSPQQS